MDAELTTKARITVHRHCIKHRCKHLEAGYGMELLKNASLVDVKSSRQTNALPEVKQLSSKTIVEILYGDVAAFSVPRKSWNKHIVKLPLLWLHYYFLWRWVATGITWYKQMLNVCLHHNTLLLARSVMFMRSAHLFWSMATLRT